VWMDGVPASDVPTDVSGIAPASKKD
jgi:hypothetical protein